MLVRWNPISELERFRRDMDRLFDTRNTTEDGESITNWTPRVDIVEAEKSYEVTVDLPGVEAKDVSIDVENKILTVSGRREGEKLEENKAYRRRERIFGLFSRTFTLPEHVDAENIKASYSNGVLKLSVPKKEEVLPRKIQIEVN